MSEPKYRYKLVELDDLKIEDGARELASSPEMQPYVRLGEAVVLRRDVSAELEAIRQLPLEQQYLWRVVSALKRGFADFDDLSIKADRHTLGPEDLAKVMELVKLRPMQFAMFLAALVGVEEMERSMVEAIAAAKQVG